MNIKRMLIALRPEQFASQQNGLKFKCAAPECALGILIKGPRADTRGAEICCLCGGGVAGGGTQAHTQAELSLLERGRRLEMLWPISETCPGAPEV